MHGGRVIAKALAAQGVTHLFGLCGDHVNAIFDGCADEGIRIVDTRHVAAAVHMAEGWSLATGSPGVACVTGGPGLMNAMSAIADASLAGVPLVVLTSSIRQDEVGRGYPQDMDQMSAVKPICAWAQTVHDAAHMTQWTGAAVGNALDLRGPTVLVIPLDVQLAQADPVRIDLDGRPTRGGAEVVEAAMALRAAERPIAIVGEGAFWSGAAGALAEFAEATGIPVFTHRAGRGLLPDDHEFAFGPPTFLRGSGAVAFPKCDVLLVVGTELDIVLMFGNLAPQARLIRIDRDADRVRRHKEPDVAVVGDESVALRALAHALGGRRWEPWAAEIRDVIDEDPPLVGDGPVHPARLAMELTRAVGAPATIALDAGALALWAFDRLPASGPGRMLTTFGTPFATLGAGLPFAMAAKLARPDEPSVALVGDGAFGFSAMELDTAARHGVDVKVVVGNDASWGIVKRQMELGFGRAVAADLADRRYDELARSLGAYGDRIESGSELPAALVRLMKTDGPALLDVKLDTPDHPAMSFIAQMFAPEG